MKLLFQVKENPETKEKIYVVGDSLAHGVQELNAEQLADWKKNGKLMIEGLYFSEDGTPTYDEEVYGKQKCYLMSMLGESRKEQGKKPKIIGYKLYVPEEGMAKCYTTSSAVEKAMQYGLINGEVRQFNGTNYLHGKVKVEPADKHAGLYLQMYHRRKDYANRKGRPCEKIVRVDPKHLELRSIPAGTFGEITTPVGVHFINLKYWKLLGVKHMEFKDRPKVKHLALGKSVKEIKANKPENNMELVPEHMSLGAFAGWGLETVELNYGLEVIGEEAFRGNRLKKVAIKTTVKTVGERAFTGNPIEELTFDFRKPKGNKVTQLRIEDDAFAGLPLGGKNSNEYFLKLPPVKYIGRNAFKGTTISGVSFAPGTSLKVIATGSFANTQIEEFWVPDSVEVICAGAFAGTPIKKLIFGKNSKIKTISAEAADRKFKIIGTRVQPK